jgi:hypothetical protein
MASISTSTFGLLNSGVMVRSLETGLSSPSKEPLSEDFASGGGLIFRFGLMGGAEDLEGDVATGGLEDANGFRGGKGGEEEGLATAGSGGEEEGFRGGTGGEEEGLVVVGSGEEGGALRGNMGEEVLVVVEGGDGFVEEERDAVSFGEERGGDDEEGSIATLGEGTLGVVVGGFDKIPGFADFGFTAGLGFPSISLCSPVVAAMTSVPPSLVPTLGVGLGDRTGDTHTGSGPTLGRGGFSGGTLLRIAGRGSATTSYSGSTTWLLLLLVVPETSR